MAEVELECAVYGEGAVFPVKIARDAKVSALQVAIAARYRVMGNRVVVDPAALTLYLAKKNGVWLKNDDSADDLLSGKIDTGYKKMLPSWALYDEEYFEKEFQPGREESHVLVELPEATSPPRVAVAVPIRPKWIFIRATIFSHSWKAK